MCFLVLVQYLHRCLHVFNCWNFLVRKEWDDFSHISKPLIYVQLLHFRMMYWQSVASLVSPGGILVSSSIQIGPGIFFFFVHLWQNYERPVLHWQWILMYPYCIYLKLLCTCGILLYWIILLSLYVFILWLSVSNDKSSIAYPCTSNMAIQSSDVTSTNF